MLRGNELAHCHDSTFKSLIQIGSAPASISPSTKNLAHDCDKDAASSAKQRLTLPAADFHLQAVDPGFPAGESHAPDHHPP